MAEQALLSSDGYLPMQHLEDVEAMEDVAMPDVKPQIENLNLNLSSDISLGELNDTLQQHQNKETEKAGAVENQEETIESPTTAEDTTFVFKCIFCEQILSGKDEPKILKCLHNACGNCVQQKIFEQSDESNAGPGGTATNKGFDCTICGYYTDAQHLLDNQFLIELTSNEDLSNKLVELKCSSCSDDAPASSWCADCAEYICDNCVQAHQRLKITKDHTIKSKEEGLQESQTFATAGPTPLFCAMHPHEKLSLFCENCDKLTCRDCQLMEHRDHKYKFTHEIASDARKMIHAMLTDISYKRVLLNSAMKVIDDRQALISEKKQSLVQEITNLVVRLTNTINVRGKQLVARLNEVCDSKQKTLDEKKIALNHLSKITDHCIQFTRNILENGSDSALLFSKKHVTTHLQRIKSRRADIPNPEIPVRIHLALDKVPDLIKVISSIGQIIVDGRIYPAQTPSPGNMPPQNSPSPSHLQQAPPPGYQDNRMMAPAYGQQYPNQAIRPNIGQMGLPPQSRGIVPQNINHSIGNVQNTNPSPQNAQSLGQNVGPNMGPTMGGISPMSLAQQLNSNANLQRMQIRPQLRSIMPNLHGRLISNSQQQVTSSTHPQGMMPDRNNLRGLLQPNGSAVYVRTGPGQYQAVQPQYAQQFQNRFQGVQPYHQQSAHLAQPHHQTQQQHQQQQQHLQHQQHLQAQQQQHQQQQQQRQAPRPPSQGFQSPPLRNTSQSTTKWHIPQPSNETTANNGPQSRTNAMPTLNNSFKIVLKQQNNDQKNPVAATVTSTIPKTPSPNHLQGSTEKSLDKFCEDSVNDLMATIAKLDSNGVQVLAESRPKTGGSPHVDSSTGDVSGATGKAKSETVEMGKDDPNEDWCAVCMDGGELVCCDKCPKVFHQFCHIPNLSVEESETWQCLLCMNFADIPDSGEQLENELTQRQKKIAERLVLELYCQYEPSLPFREVIGSENTSYHEIIKNPIALDTIRHKLDWTSADKYTSLDQLVRDVRLMFRNAYTFNPTESQVYADAKTLEKFFDEQLEKWLPEYAYETFDDDDNIQPPCKKYRRVITDDE